MSKKRSTPGRQLDAATADIVELLDASRRVAARSVNAVMTATYWAVGRRIAEQERTRGGGTGTPLTDAQLGAIARELSARFGRTYSIAALRTMRAFHAIYPMASIPAGSYFDELAAVAGAFALSWSHYVELVKLTDDGARRFYEAQAVREGWTVRQLRAQIRTGVFQIVEQRKLRPPEHRGLAPPPPPPPAPLPDEILRDPVLRQFFHVPPGAERTRPRGSMAEWLARSGRAREPGGAWLQ